MCVVVVEHSIDYVLGNYNVTVMLLYTFHNNIYLSFIVLLKLPDECGQ